jgi:hypothetical protein
MSRDNLMKYIPVEINKWGEMVQAMTRVKELEANLEKSDGVVWTLTIENARLKQQVALLRKLGTEMGKHLPDSDAANRAYIDFEAGGKS